MNIHLFSPFILYVYIFLFHWYYFQTYVPLGKRQNLMEIKPVTCACF